MAEGISKQELKEFGDKIRSESMNAKVTTSSDLTCSDCVFKFDDSDPFMNGSVDDFGIVHGPVTMCQKYEHKPQGVLNGGECELKETDSEQ